MKVYNLEVDNYKRLKAINLTPEDDMIILQGENEQGKSTIIDSIFVAMGGKLPEKPIRDNEERAEINLDIGEYRVKRVITKKKDGGYNSYLTIKDKDGTKMSSPQKIIDDIMGKITFDPLEFAKYDAKKQRDVLLELVGLDFAFEEEEIKRLYDERRLVGRERDKLSGVVKNLETEDFTGVPDKETSLEEITNQVNSLTSQINEIEKKETNLSQLNSKQSDLIAKISRLLQELNKAKKELAETESLLAEASAELGKFNKEELFEKRKDLILKSRKIDENNSKFRKRKEYLQKQIELKTLEDQYNNFTKEIEQYDEDKKKRIQSAKMPIKGLSFDEDGVLYNSIPLSQLSSAAEFKVCLAIGMAMNPQLKIITSKYGSLLDDTNMKIVEEMTKGKGYQSWIERVGNNSETGILIEDGEIREKSLQEISA